MKGIAVTLSLLLAGSVVMAGTKAFRVPASMLRGQPRIEAGKFEGYYIWVDKDGLHLRWSASSTSLLFTGRLDTDKPVKEVKRLREDAGGWARPHGNRIVLFSSTVRPGEMDGIDVVIPGGRKSELQIDLDGKPPEVEKIFLGKEGKHPRATPLKLYLR